MAITQVRAPRKSIFKYSGKNSSAFARNEARKLSIFQNFATLGLFSFVYNTDFFRKWYKNSNNGYLKPKLVVKKCWSDEN